MLPVHRAPTMFPSLFDFSPALSALRTLNEVPRAADHSAVQEDDESYTVRFQVPGMSRDDITLKLSDSTLTMEGTREVAVPEGFKAIRRERSSLTISKTIRFSRPIDPDRVEARLVDGVLTISLPKAESARARHITIR